MKTASPALVTLLNGSTQFIFADLLTIVTASATYRYTNAACDIVSDSNTFPCSGPIFHRTGTKTAVGIEVDSMRLTISPSDADMIEGLPFVRAARMGALDGAKITVERAFLAAWPAYPGLAATAVGALHVFSGSASEVRPSRTEIEIEVKSETEVLNVKIPRNLYQPPCVHTLYDSLCGVQRASYTVTGTISASPAPTVTSAKLSRAEADGYFDQGVIIFTSGVNAGLRRTVKKWASGTATWALPLQSSPAIGDAFSIYPGCDKRQATCAGKFSNSNRHSGYPYIPKPEAAI